MVNSLTEFSLFTTTAKPSMAILTSVISTPASLAFFASASFIGLLLLARFVVLFKSAAMPVPEPPPVTWMVTSLFFLLILLFALFSHIVAIISLYLGPMGTEVIVYTSRILLSNIIFNVVIGIKHGVTGCDFQFFRYHKVAGLRKKSIGVHSIAVRFRIFCHYEILIMP